MSRLRVCRQETSCEPQDDMGSSAPARRPRPAAPRARAGGPAAQPAPWPSSARCPPHPQYLHSKAVVHHALLQTRLAYRHQTYLAASSCSASHGKSDAVATQPCRCCCGRMVLGHAHRPHWAYAAKFPVTLLTKAGRLMTSHTAHRHGSGRSAGAPSLSRADAMYGCAAPAPPLPPLPLPPASASPPPASCAASRSSSRRCTSACAASARASASAVRAAAASTSPAPHTAELV